MALLLATPLLVACSVEAQEETYDPPLYPNETPELRASINKWADYYEIPRELVHRLAIRESTHRPWAVNRPYYGLLQILPATARSMGFQGQPKDLLVAETNLEFAGKYLRGAWLISDGSQDNAVKHYSRGYWHEAKRRGMLKETGLIP
ncbi:MAG: transglycosylase SLT domain-containing protein [Paracoccaceae bacterium]